MDQQTNNKKTLKKWQKITLIVVASIVALFLIIGIALYSLFSRYYGMTNYAPLDSTEEIILNIETESEIPWGDGEETVDTDDETTAPDDDTTTTPSGTTSSTPNTTTPNTTTQAPDTDDTPIIQNPSFLVEAPSYIAGDDPEYKETKILANALNDYRMSFGKHIKNILLIGSDGLTPDERGRSDSMILVTVNEKTGQIILTSLPRDLYVFIPKLPAEYSFNRLNAAYAHGGVSLLIETIEVNFKIKIDKYARVNFTAFTDIVDTMGGIDIELKQSEITYLEEHGIVFPEGTKPGMVRLGGTAALEYCRCRKVTKFDPAKGKDVSGDFARTLRQRTFMTAVFERAKSLNISELNELLETFLPYITHNFTKTEILAYVADFPKYIKYEFKTQHLLVKSGYEYATLDGRSVYKTNFKKTWEYLEDCINGKA